MNLPCGVKLWANEVDQASRMLQNVRDNKREMIRYRNEKRTLEQAALILGGFESFEIQQTPPLLLLNQSAKDYRRQLHATLSAIEARDGKYRDAPIGRGAYGRVFEVRHSPTLWPIADQWHYSLSTRKRTRFGVCLLNG